MNIIKEIGDKSDYKKLKIAMIGHKRIPSREGGIEIVVNELATRLAKRGHSVTVYNRSGHHVSGSEFDTVKITDDYQGIKLVNVFTINAKGLAALTSSISATVLAVLACFNKQKRYDCLHYHAEGPSALVWLPHLLGIRTVVTIHGLDWQRAKWGGLATKYLKFGEKMAAKYADEVIVLSKNVQDYFKEIYNREVVYIPNGISHPHVREANIIREKWHLEKDEYILYLGRIVPEKGIHYLIEAFKNTKTTKKLVIAGGSSDTQEYSKHIKDLGQQNERIIFTGFVQGETLEELYSNAYIYCLPSDLEGMPISLLEGMSYGNCCIVSDIPECAEVVEDHALVFKHGDIPNLKNVLQQCCENEKLVSEYKARSAEFIECKYNWEEVVKQTIELYEEEMI